MSMVYGDFNISTFWAQSDYADKHYVLPMLGQEMVDELESKLGYKLPTAYIELMRTQNGGTPTLTNHRTKTSTSWASDHVAITTILGIDLDNFNSLGNSRFWEEEWGYPSIGIYCAVTPTAGHDMICLDYRKCGPQGEPQVVHIAQEYDYKVTHIAENFESFIRGLEPEDAFGEE